MRDVVRQIAINPNTVHRAYRELEQQGLTEGRPGSGTFVQRSLDAAPERRAELQESLETWVRTARAVGLDDEGIAALVAEATRNTPREGTTMTAALETIGLGRRYRSNWGLRDCSLQVREGSITGLVGPNGAGKSTLLRLAAGLSRPSAGIRADLRRGGRPERHRPSGPHRLPRPAAARCTGASSVEEMLTFGRRLNDSWDDAAARGWLDEFEIPLDRKVAKLSLGQQAQVALAVCMGKRPDLLLLDEPVAALDPLARRKLLQNLLGTVAERGTTVFLSSHIVSELAPVCDELIVLSAARVQTSGTIEGLLADHRLLIGPRLDADPAEAEVISSSPHDSADHVAGPGPVARTRTGLADAWNRTSRRSSSPTWPTRRRAQARPPHRPPAQREGQGRKVDRGQMERRGRRRPRDLVRLETATHESADR